MKGQLVVKNWRNDRIRLVIEPWADEYDLAPKGRRAVRMTGPESVEIEITVEDDRIVIYGWEGSILDGDDTSAENRPPPQI